MKRWLVCLCLFCCASAGGCQSEKEPVLIKDDYIQSKRPEKKKKFALQKVSEILLVEDPDTPIGVIKGLRIDQDRIYLMDTSQKRIMVFTTEGRFVHTIGRQGGGPGEFRRLYTMDVRDGLIACYDEGTRRITLFDSSGVFLNSFGARTRESVPAVSCISITSDKTLLLAHKSSKSPKKQIAEHNYPWLICEFDTLGNVLSYFASYNQDIVGDKLERPLQEYEFSAAQFRVASPNITHLWRENTPVVVVYNGRQSIKKTINVSTALTKPEFREKDGNVRQWQRPTAASVRARIEKLRNNPIVKTSISDILFDETHSILLVLQQKRTYRGTGPGGVGSENNYLLSLFNYDSGQNILSDMRFPDREEQPRYVSIDMDSADAIYCLENDAPDNYVIGKYRLVEESAKKE